jgi:hypothetical protein
MNNEKYSTMEITTYQNKCHLFSIEILDVKITTFKWIEFLNTFEKNLQLLESEDVKYFILHIDAKYADVLDMKQVGKVIDLFKKNQSLFEEKLICSLIYVEGNIINIFKDIFNKFYNPIKPIHFLKKQELNHEFIEESIMKLKN